MIDQLNVKRLCCSDDKKYKQIRFLDIDKDITLSDIEILKKTRFHTYEFVMNTTKKELISIGGLSE
uniref:Phage protein n=1 Tax=Strongyloides papillosus TaxID=174720 RepID=A0A0N5C3H8_STREA